MAVPADLPRAVVLRAGVVHVADHLRLPVTATQFVARRCRRPNGRTDGRRGVGPGAGLTRCRGGRHETVAVSVQVSPGGMGLLSDAYARRGRHPSGPGSAGASSAVLHELVPGCR